MSAAWLTQVQSLLAAAHQLGGEEPTGVIESSEDEIAFENAVVVTPANATLVRDLTLRVPGGTNLLVTGQCLAALGILLIAAASHLLLTFAIGGHLLP